MIDPATTTRPHVRIEEFGEYYGVARSTVYNWIAWGWLPAEHVAGALRIPTAIIRQLDAPECHDANLVQLRNRLT